MRARVNTTGRASTAASLRRTTHPRWRRARAVSPATVAATRRAPVPVEDCRCRECEPAATCAGDLSCRFAEIRGAHLRDRAAASVASPVERDLAGFHHVAAVAHFERELRVLLDQQDRHAFARRSRAPSRRPSAPSAARAPSTARRAAAASAATSARGPSRASAARRPTACPRSAGGAPSGAETARTRARRRPRSPRGRCAMYAPIARFSSIVSAPNTPRPSGTIARPRRTSSNDGLAGDVLAVVADRARLDRLQAADALERRRLARAVGADQADELALADVEVDALDRVDAAVGDLELVELEQRRVRCVPSSGALEVRA